MLTMNSNYSSAHSTLHIYVGYVQFLKVLRWVLCKHDSLKISCTVSLNIMTQLCWNQSYSLFYRYKGIYYIYRLYPLNCTAVIWCLST